MRKTVLSLMSVAALALAGCAGELSTLSPAGPAARSIATLWWVMLIGAGAIFALVMVLAGLAFLSNRGLKAAGPAITGMMSCFVMLLHVPRVIATPDSRMEWTMTAVALTLTGAAFALWRLNVESPEKAPRPALPPARAVQ